MSSQEMLSRAESALEDIEGEIKTIRGLHGRIEQRVIDETRIAENRIEALEAEISRLKAQT